MEQVDALTKREVDQIITVNLKQQDQPNVSVSEEDEKKIQAALEKRFKK